MKSFTHFVRGPLAIGLAFVTATAGWVPAQVIVDPCPQVVQAYRLEYRTVFEEHQVTSYKIEHETQYVESQITVQKPVMETQMNERRYTVQRPVTETSEREERFTVMKPVMETVIEDRSFDRVRDVQETVEREVRVHSTKAGLRNDRARTAADCTQSCDRVRRARRMSHGARAGDHVYDSLRRSRLFPTRSSLQAGSSVHATSVPPQRLRG